MYTAINDNIIVEKQGATVTASGIVLSEQGEGAVFEFVVVGTTEETKTLQGKVIYTERRHCQELPQLDGKRYASVSYKHVLAVK